MGPQRSPSAFEVRTGSDGRESAIRRRLKRHVASIISSVEERMPRRGAFIKIKGRIAAARSQLTAEEDTDAIIGYDPVKRILSIIGRGRSA